MSQLASHRAALVKQIANNLGFMACGISASGFLSDDAPRLETWLSNGYHGKMAYMENHFDKRLDTRKLVEGSKSVITVLYNYYPKSDTNHTNDQPKFAKYAFGEDYHYVVKDKLRAMVAEMEQQIGAIHGRVFVDSAPVLERAWAAKAGLGWIGKHSLLITKQQGSFYFIGQIISDLELEADGPTTDHCGSCTACIDACPTEAIVADRVIDSRRCISYLTIELKDAIPFEFKGKMEDWVFGCDICQDVCPWNRFSRPTDETRFEMVPEIARNNWHDWEEITQDIFNDIFKKSPVKRPKYSGFLRNLHFAKRSLDE